MDSKSIKQEISNLDVCREELRKLLSEYETLSLSGTQNPISVRVENECRSMAVTELDRAYSQKLIRGREMIMLGVKLAYNNLIEHKRREIAECKRKIKLAVCV